MNRKINIFLILAVIFLIFTPKKGAAQLQELEVNPITNEGPIPVFRDYPDLAAIFVQSSLNNLSFESNLEIVEEMGNPAAGEYILLVQPVRQSIRVNAPGFIQSRIQLRNLEERDVIYYSIEPVADETIPVIIRVGPTDAIVRVDGEPVDISTSIQLEEGTHTIEITGDGFKNIEQEIFIDQENNFFEFTPEEVEPQLVRIETEPAEVTVFVDGVEEGETDRNGMIDFFRFPGEYQITASKSGYLSREITIDVQEQGQNMFSLQLERSAAVLSIETTPPDAQVSIDRRVVDASQPIEISPGLHRLEVNREGYQPYIENISIEQNQELQRQVNLEAYTGILQIQISPTDAQVTLINEQGQTYDQWTGSRRIADVPEGIYQLTAEADQYETYEETIQIERDQALETNINLMSGIAHSQTPQVEESQADQSETQIDDSKNFTLAVGASYAEAFESEPILGPKLEIGYKSDQGFSLVLDASYYSSEIVDISTFSIIELNLNLLYRFVDNENFESYFLAGPGMASISFSFDESEFFDGSSTSETEFVFNAGVGLAIDLNFADLFLEYDYKSNSLTYAISTGLRFEI